MPRVTEENRKANAQLVAVLGHIADGKGATRAQVALAWLLAQERKIPADQIAPPPGTALTLDPVSEAKRRAAVDEGVGEVAPELARYQRRTVW